ncbi:MAG: DUF4974 domain-containing protein [Prevotella sp.]|nr:DUF4974 domain-containing protein [Prevotella sp.]
MSKLRKLFDMTEHPERYQDSDWQQLAPGHDITDDDISSAWSRVLATENKMAADEHGAARGALDMAADEHGAARNKETVSVRVSPLQEKNHPLLKIAAAVAAVMMLSGIAWAAFGSYFAKEKSPQETARTDLQHNSPSTAADTLLVPPYPRTPVPPKNVVFENVELQDILQKMTEHYRLEGIDYSRQELRHLRLYYEWDTAASLQAVLDELNAFEQIKISTDGKKLNVE